MMSLTPEDWNLEMFNQEPSRPSIKVDKREMRIRFYPKKGSKLSEYYKISKEFLRKKAGNIIVGIIVTAIGRIIVGIILKY